MKRGRKTIDPKKRQDVTLAIPMTEAMAGKVKAEAEKRCMTVPMVVREAIRAYFV